MADFSELLGKPSPERPFYEAMTRNPAELRSYSPTIRERIAQALFGEERPSVAKRNFVEGLLGRGGANSAVGLADFTPFGAVFGGQEGGRSADRGDWVGAVAGAAGAIPAVGGALKPAVKAGGVVVRPYKNVPDSLMGFRRSGQNKAFEETKYPHTQSIIVDFGDGDVMVDAIKGMNPAHALERAYRNWPDAVSIKLSESPLK